MGDVNQKATGKPQPTPTPCLCTALRQASRAVTRIHDAELRGAGLRSVQGTSHASRMLSIISRCITTMIVLSQYLSAKELMSLLAIMNDQGAPGIDLANNTLNHPWT